MTRVEMAWEKVEKVAWLSEVEDQGLRGQGK
jgi:hypothetical protein